MPKVSVVIPIYNVEDYLDKCLSSVKEQTFKDIEVICVNDGTKDNSQLIVDKFVAEDKRFISLIKENGGLSDARNYGIPYAKGDYIFFLDSDDSLELNAIELLFDFATKNNNDLVICGYNEVSCNGKPTVKIVPEYPEFTGTLIDRPFILNKIPHCAWNKLYKKELFTESGIRFPKGLYYEDAGTSPIVYLESKSIGYLPKPLINYLIDRPGNITQSVNKKIADVVKDLELVNNYYIQKEMFSKLKDDLCYFNLRLIFDNLWKLKGIKENRDFFIKFFEDSYDLLDKYFDNWQKNNFFKTKGLRNMMINTMKKNRKTYKKFLFGDAK